MRMKIMTTMKRIIRIKWQGRAMTRITCRLLQGSREDIPSGNHCPTAGEKATSYILHQNILHFISHNWKRQHFISYPTTGVSSNPHKLQNLCHIHSVWEQNLLIISWSSFLCLLWTRQERWWEPSSPWARLFFLLSAYSEYSPSPLTPTNLLQHHHQYHHCDLPPLLFATDSHVKPLHCSPHRLGWAQPPDRETSHRWRSPTEEYLWGGCWMCALFHFWEKEKNVKWSSWSSTVCLSATHQMPTRLTWWWTCCKPTPVTKCK